MRYFVVGLVVFGLSLYVLGPFALLAIIGVLIASGIALRRGLGHEQALRLIVPVGVLLLVAGLALSMLIVPTSRMVRGHENSNGTSGSEEWVTAPTVAPFP
jgi:hypothetical protein